MREKIRTYINLSTTQRSCTVTCGHHHLGTITNVLFSEEHASDLTSLAEQQTSQLQRMGRSIFGSTLFALCFARYFLSAESLLNGVRIDGATSTWRDRSNRTMLWHGINFVEKGHPFYPVIDDATIETMTKMGMNVVRLGVMMGGTFPTNATLNEDYLTTIESIIDRLWNKNIVTIIDLHQDVLSANICGEGVPTWMNPTTELGSLSFPRPLTLSGSKPDAENNSWTPPVPCSPAGVLKFIGWSEFYMTDACGKAFQKLYDGKGIVGAMIVKHWDAVSKRLSGHPGVLAYEILNEPWFGDWIHDPSIILEAGQAEKKTVGPFMERMHDVIRANDEKTPVMYSPAELNNRFMRHVGYESGFLRGEPMSFHVYCITGTDGDGPTSPFSIPLCHFNDDFQLTHREEDLRRTFGTAQHANTFSARIELTRPRDTTNTITGLGTAGFVTEFGAVSDKPTGVNEVRFVAAHMDSMSPPISWTFWVRTHAHVLSLSLSLLSRVRSDLQINVSITGS